MRRLSGESDDGSFQCADERERNRPGGRARWDQSVFAPRVDQTDEALDQPRLNALELAPNRMVLATELDSERHSNPRDVSPAEDGVTAGHREQRSDRIGCPVGRFADLTLPRLVGPAEYRQRKILLVFELVVERTARVPRLAGDLFEDQVSVAGTGEASRRRLQQCAARTGAPFSLGCGASGAPVPESSYHLHTYMYV